MADVMDARTRSALMGRIRGRNTKPELLVRKLLHRAGYRYRLHRRDLPGTPDIVLPTRRWIVEVHGCFWHGHEGCKLAAKPKTRPDFWATKIDANRRRDARVKTELQGLGWNVFTVWECDLGDMNALRARLEAALGPPGPIKATGCPESTNRSKRDCCGSGITRPRGMTG
jgi:DNA mismatch endonuclease Vsr